MCENVAFKDLPGLGDDEYPGFPADECPEDMPDLSRHHSVVADILKREPGLYDMLRCRRTALGVGLAKCIKTGMDNKGHPMIRTLGAVAGDEECYETFRPLFDALIHDRHGDQSLHPPCARGTSDRFGLTTVQPDTSGKYVLSTQVRIARSFRGTRFPPAIGFEERREVERVAVRALLELDGPLKGEYYPLVGSTSYAQKPGGMSLDEEEALMRTKLLFTHPDSTATLCSGIGRHWPDGRGVFMNSDRSLSAWLNEEEHLRLVTVRLGANVQAAFTELADTLEGILASLRRHGDGPDGFAYSERLGFLTSCPPNLGTAMRVSVIVQLPLLTQQEDGLVEWCTSRHLTVRGAIDEEGSQLKGVLEVSNRDKLGISEVQTVNLIVEATAELVAAERRLESGEPAGLVQVGCQCPVGRPDLLTPIQSEHDEASWDVAGHTLRTVFADAVAATSADAVSKAESAPMCRSCGNSGMDFLGNVCTCCSSSQKSNEKVEPPAPMCSSCGNTGLDFLGDICACSYGQKEVEKITKMKIARVLKQAVQSDMLALAMETVERAATPTEVTLIKKQTADFLKEACLSGELSNTLGSLRGNEATPTEVTLVRQQTRDILKEACLSGELSNALGSLRGNKDNENKVVRDDTRDQTKNASEDEVDDELDNIRMRMMTMLKDAAEDGSLDDHLLKRAVMEVPGTQVTTDKAELDNAMPAAVENKDADPEAGGDAGVVDMLRARVRCGLEDSFSSGRLEKWLDGVNMRADGAAASSDGAATFSATWTLLEAVSSYDRRIGLLQATAQEVEQRIKEQSDLCVQLEAELVAAKQESHSLDTEIEQQQAVLDQQEEMNLKLQESQRQLVNNIDMETLKQRHAALDNDTGLYSARSELSTACTIHDISERLPSVTTMLEGSKSQTLPMVAATEARC